MMDSVKSEFWTLARAYLSGGSWFELCNFLIVHSRLTYSEIVGRIRDVSARRYRIRCVRNGRRWIDRDDHHVHLA